MRPNDLSYVEWALTDLAEVREHLSGITVRPIPKRIYELAGELYKELLTLEKEVDAAIYGEDDTEGGE
jgi:hypothetical protein